MGQNTSRDNGKIKRSKPKPDWSQTPPNKRALAPLSDNMTLKDDNFYDLPENLVDKKYIVGVDFGTSFTGFSVLPVPKDGSIPSKVLTEKNWPDQPPRVNSPKVPTVINYYVSPEEVEAQDFGWSVDCAFPDPDVVRFDRVKLYLGKLNASKQGQITQGMPELPPGITPRNLISQYLLSLKPYVESLIGKHIQQQSEAEYFLISPSEIMYCLTIPIEWSEAHVSVMREAAFDAGFIETLDSDNLLFCHEPVAAAFSLVKKFENVLTGNSSALVCDAGGILKI